MSARTPSNGQRSIRVRPIQVVVDELLKWLKKKYGPELDESVRKQLNDEEVKHEFVRWLKEGVGDSLAADVVQREWFKQLLAGKVDEAVKSGLAWDCLQVVVLAYLPGPQYFQGAYIHSNLRKPDELMKVKSSFHVPHLSGAVSWMSSYLLNYHPEDKYVVLQDAQLDLRGRVAVPDRQLGNRSVLGFPVSIIKDNRDPTSISGFFFFSHPIPRVFPVPTAVEERSSKSPVRNVKRRSKNHAKNLSKTFEDVRTIYESSIASAIESYISRDYGESVLTTSRKIREPKRTPLLTLSDNDPTGFLVTILFESSYEGSLSAECDVNENVLLDTAARYLRVASMYAERWAPPFVWHMKELGRLIENSNVHSQLPMVWFFRGGTQSTQQFYPEELVRKASFDRLAAVDKVPAISHGKDMGGIVQEIINLFAPPIDPSRQADLVIPICSDRGRTTQCLGFFRINSVIDLPSSERRAAAFQNLFTALAGVREEINSAVAALIIGLEEERYRSLGDSDVPPAGGTSEMESWVHKKVQHAKLWIDTFYLVINWLVRQMHHMVLRLTNDVELRVADENWHPITKQEERLIGFALDTFGNEELGLAFKHCKEMWKRLLEMPPTPFMGPWPTISFLSFWPRMRVPVFAKILPGSAERAVSAEQAAFAEEEFTDLFRSDPGLLRMLMILVSIPQWRDPSIALGPDDDLYRSLITYGVPTNPHITELTLDRTPGDDLAIDLKWTDKKPGRPAQQHHIRILWDKDEGTRNLTPHAISFLPRKVARHIGENLLADLNLKLTPEALDNLQDTSFDPKEYFDLQRFISSSRPDVLKRQLSRLKGALLYGSTADSVWRILKVKERPLAFVAALCNPEVNRPAVLAFRDLALANAQAFYVAREYDAHREAADDYSRSVYAVAHGYIAPIRRLAFAVGVAKTFVTGNPDRRAVREEMEGLERMATGAELLAEAAMFYAWRKTQSALKPTLWKEMCEQVEAVISAIELPRKREVLFERGGFDDKITVDSSHYLWCHLISKLIANGIKHGGTDPTGIISYKVMLAPVKVGQKLALRIMNFVNAGRLEETVKRVRCGLVEGKMGVSDGTHGYGLLEARNCCKLLGIDAGVDAIDQSSQMVITLWMNWARKKAHESVGR